jgi:hypothetical protein
MSLFDNINLNTAEAAKETEQDTSGYKILDTDIYDAVIKVAYFQPSKSGALGMHCIFNIPTEGFEYKQSFYITKRDGSTTYTDRNGVERPIPGFSHANHLCYLTTGKTLSESKADLSKVFVSIYNSDQGKEVPTEVEALPVMVGKKVKLGIQKVVENKAVQQGNKWVDTNEPRTKNDVDRIFDEDGLSFAEKKGGESTGLLDNWKKRNAGKEKNRFNPNKGISVPSTAPQSSSQPSQSPSVASTLFDD